jgi:NADPH-dependent curcumin reductase CurA
MSHHTVKGIHLVSYPSALPEENIFKFVDVVLPEVKDNEARAKVLYISVDPYMRNRMRPGAWELNVIPAGAGMLQIVESKSEKLPLHAIYIKSNVSWQEEIIVSDSEQLTHVPSDNVDYLSLMSTAGLTAYVGLFSVGSVKEGETVVVTGAAGSVGLLVGQLAKLKGCHVVGICGSDDKCKLLKETGFDHAINYNTTKDIAASLRESCPKGIDVFFENVGGPVSDAIFEQLNKFARVPVCGQIYLYNEPPESPLRTGPRNWITMIYRAIRVEGFLVSDYAAQFPKYIAELTTWHKEGKLRVVTSVAHGIEGTPKAFVGLFTGANTGKQVVKFAKQ